MIIYASNIHVTGGRVLLEDLLRSVDSGCVLFAHSKLKVDPEVLKNVQVISVEPSVSARLKAELKLKNVAKSHDVTLCFGNLPPIFRLKSKTSLYFQNTILLKETPKMKFGLKIRIKHFIERIWLEMFMKNVDCVYVQSIGVKNAFQSQFPGKKVIVAPFLGCQPVIPRTSVAEFDFVYVASADPHKNQHRLLSAWRILASEGLFPSLALTFNSAPIELLNEIQGLQSAGVKIKNVTELPHDEVLKLYAKCGALIFPSLTESFGMPLIEARDQGLPILASEMDYVREFVDPVETFDPYSEKSIANAVKRYLKVSSDGARQSVLSPAEFLKKLDP